MITGGTGSFGNAVLNKVKMPALYLLGSWIANFALVMILNNRTALGIYAIPLSSAIILFVWGGLLYPDVPCRVLKLKWNTFYTAIFKMVFSSVVIFGVTILLHRAVEIQSWFALIAFCCVSGCLGLAINLCMVLNKADRKRVFGAIRRKIGR